jgi:hypothetical protein
MVSIDVMMAVTDDRKRGNVKYRFVVDNATLEG